MSLSLMAAGQARLAVPEHDAAVADRNGAARLALLGHAVAEERDALARAVGGAGRALLARAACKANTGDAAGNRADLHLYLRELPDGPRAAQVRRALGGTGE